MAALVAVIITFSWGSTLVKLAETPAVALAFWRLTVSSAIWVVVLRVTEGRWLSRVDLRASLVPGIAFGLNITCFFTGVTRTTVAAAEFTGALTPLLVVPAGVVYFHERTRLAPLAFGAVSFVGLAIVLFNAPPTGEFSWTGVWWIVGGMSLWATYLLTSRHLRQGRSVAVVMAHITPLAAATALPLSLVTAPGDLLAIDTRSVVFILLLALVTGTLAHGLMVYAQRSVPIGAISMLQVSQPALAVLWSVLFLGSSVRGVQIVGMALVLVGLAAITTATHRLG